MSANQLVARRATCKNCCQARRDHCKWCGACPTNECPYWCEPDE